MKIIVLTGGGTAGHVMPHIALLPELKKYFDKIIYIGTNSIEKQIAKEHNIDFFEIQATKFIRKNIFKNLLLPFKLISSIKKSKNILKKINPSVIFSKGGFVALPVIIAARILGIPTISHESDMSMGLANKIILKYCNVMITSFSKTSTKNKKCIFIGSPIRQEMFDGNKQKAKEICKFEKVKPTVLVFGGSLGAKALNDIVAQSILKLSNNYNIIHITGKNNKTNIINKSYYQVEFTSDIQDFFALSDIVVSRGGANSLFELLAIKKPMIIIPLPKGNSRGDQVENAKYFEKNGWAKVILQEDLTKSKFVSTIENLDTKKLKTNMQNSPYDNANKKIVTQILRYAKKNED